MQPYKTETTRQSSKLVTAGFLDKIESGRVKEAQDEGSEFIRTKLRQASFAREIMIPQLLGDDELDRRTDSDLPMKIVEIEPDSIAVTVPFEGSGPRRWFKGPRFEIHFGKVESEHFHKSKFQLMTYQNDIRQILSDNSVKDMADQEDSRFYQTCLGIVNQRPTQQVNTSGGLTASNVVEGIKNMLSRKIQPGKLLMTEELYADALKLPATSIGDAAASSQYREGLTGKSLWGMPVVTTIKNDIIPSNEMWFFAPQNYLGRFYLLQDATLFIEQRADMIEFWSYSAPGMGIGNSSGMTRVTF